MAEDAPVYVEARSTAPKARWPATGKERLVRDVLLIGVTAGWAFVYMIWRKNKRLHALYEELPHRDNVWLVALAVVATLAGAGFMTAQTAALSLMFNLTGIGLLVGAIAFLGANTEAALAALAKEPRVDFRFVLLAFGGAALLLVMGDFLPVTGLRAVAIVATLTMFWVVGVFNLDMDDALHPYGPAPVE